MGNRNSNKVKKLVDIDTLNLGFDLKTGQVFIGVDKGDGALDEEMPVKDFSEHFYTMMDAVFRIRMESAALAEKPAPKIILPTEKEINQLGR